MSRCDSVWDGSEAANPGRQGLCEVLDCVILHSDTIFRKLTFLLRLLPLFCSSARLPSPYPSPLLPCPLLPSPFHGMWVCGSPVPVSHGNGPNWPINRRYASVPAPFFFRPLGLWACWPLSRTQIDVEITPRQPSGKVLGRRQPCSLSS